MVLSQKQGIHPRHVECYNQTPVGKWGGNSMAMPVDVEEVERVLRPWLGSLFVSSNDLAHTIAERLRAYAPYRQTLDSLRSDLETLLITRLNGLTHGSLTVVMDNYHSRRLSMALITDLTDDLMGLIFDKLTPFSANFIKLNDYSMRHPSINALRVLCQKYASYYTQEEFAFMVGVIKSVYPPEKYAGWLR